MAVDNERYRRAIEAAHRLSSSERKMLIEELARELETAVTPLALSGTWSGVSLSEAEIDEARRACWAGLGEDV